MLMLNAVLTVRGHKPNSHKGRAGRLFTDRFIKRVNERPSRVVFVLWGAYAQKKSALMIQTRHSIVAAAHPSPLSARNGFFGSKSFSKINAALKKRIKPGLNWQVPDI